MYSLTGFNNDLFARQLRMKKSVPALAFASACALLSGCTKTGTGGGTPPASHGPIRYPLPTGVAGPNAIAAGPNGGIWFVDSGNRAKPSAVGSMSTTGLVATVYFGGVQRGLSNDKIGYFGIATGPDGSLWFSEPLNGKIARITTSGAVTETNAAGSLPFKITAGPNNAMWYTLNGSSAIGEITTSVRPSATAFPIPSPRPAATANVQSIAAGSGDKLYFTDCGAQNGGLDGVGQVIVSGTAVRVVPEIAVPTQRSCPQGIVSTSDGSLWFLESSQANNIYKVARLVPASPFSHSTIVEFDMPANAGKLAFLAAASDGTLWTANNGTNPGSVTHVTQLPSSGSNAPPHFTTINAGQQPVPIVIGSDGTIWYGSPAVPALVKLVP